MWSAESRDAESLTVSSELAMFGYDWSSDGEDLLVAQEASENRALSPAQNGRKASEVWLRSAAPLPTSPPRARKLISDPAYHL